MSRLLALTLATLLVACSTEAPSPETEAAPDPNLSTTHVTPEAAAELEAAAEVEAAAENVAIETTTADAASECSVSLSISGMVCDQMCPPKVETALGAVNGVAKVEVTYPDSAKVFGSSETCNDDGQPALLKALEAAGFGGAIVNAS